MVKYDVRKMNTSRYVDRFHVLLKQLGLLDLPRHLKRPSGVGDSIEATAAAIDAAAFRLALDSAPLYPDGSSRGRLPPDPVVLLEALILLVRNNAVADISGFVPGKPTPDTDTIRMFRERLIEA